MAVAVVDFRKAFDSVSHQVLLKKLRANFGICGQALGWIASYLDGRKQYTDVSGYNSDTSRIRRYITGISARPYTVLFVRPVCPHCPPPPSSPDTYGPV